MNNLKSIQSQLNELNLMIDKWLNVGYTPSIEKRIALTRLERIYEQLMDPSDASVVLEREELEPEMEVELIIDQNGAFGDFSDEDEEQEELMNTEEQEETEEDQEPEIEVELIINEEADEEVEDVEDVEDHEDDDSIISEEVPPCEETVEEESVEEEPEQESTVEEECQDKETETQETIEEATEESTEEVVEDVVEEAPKAESEEVVEETVEEEIEEEEKIEVLNTSISKEKFQAIINELFWRDDTFFNNEIQKFRNFNSLDDALIYIGEKYTWTPNNNLAIEFIDLLENYYITK